MRETLTLLLALGLLAGCTTRANTVPEVPSPTLQSIPSLDVPRYMGTWHEIAKYPNRFQKHCTSHTQARYRLLPDGGVEVINRCRTGDGDLSEALGMARQIRPGSRCVSRHNGCPSCPGCGGTTG